MRAERKMKIPLEIEADFAPDRRLCYNQNSAGIFLRTGVNEMVMQTEEKATKPSLWDQALKVVKGDSTKELVEAFTQEMTLVAEGLCEDQARLRKAVDGLLQETEGQRQKTEQDYQNVLRQIEALSKRIEALEKPAPKPVKRGWWLGGDVVSRVTVLAGIICGTWLIVAILQLLK